MSSFIIVPPKRPEFRVELKEKDQKRPLLELINNDIFCSTKTGISNERLRLYVKETVNQEKSEDNSKDEKTVATAKNYLKLHQPIPQDIHTLYCKDIGKQVGYRNVFIAEYLGPFVIWILMYAFCFLNEKNTSASGVPRLNVRINIYSVMWLLHFGKRLFETFFVHIFSQPTMPIKNLFKNCTYYWGNTITVAYELMIFKRKEFLEEITVADLTTFVVFICFEAINLYTHISLRKMRPAGCYEHVLPTGILFKYIACPNYTFELLSWLVYAIGAQSVMCLLFFIQGLYQIWEWAGKKKSSLKKEFGKNCKVKGRLLPFRGF